MCAKLRKMRQIIVEKSKKYLDFILFNDRLCLGSESFANFAL